jgi:hypothetical protein
VLLVDTARLDENAAEGYRMLLVDTDKLDENAAEGYKMLLVDTDKFDEKYAAFDDHIAVELAEPAVPVAEKA